MFVTTHIAHCLRYSWYTQSLSAWFFSYLRGCIQKFPDWPPGARIANGTATRCSCIAI